MRPGSVDAVWKMGLVNVAGRLVVTVSWQVSMLHATEKGLKGEVDRLGKALADSLAKAKALEGSAASSAEFTAKVAELEKRVEELTSKNTYLTTNGQKYLQKTTIQKQDIKKLNEEVAELRASAAAGGGGGEAETKAAKEELDKARAAAAASEDACALLKKKVMLTYTSRGTIPSSTLPARSTLGHDRISEPRSLS